MKTEKYYFVLAVITGILCTTALGQTKLPQPDERGLIGQANPALAGIEELYVVIVPPDAEPNKDGLVWEELRAKAVQRITKAGIKIYSGPIRGSLSHLNVPLLRVYVDMLKLADSQQYVFHIQTSLATKVYLAKEPELFLKADVWKVEAVMQAVPIKDMPATVTNMVLEQVGAFIHAYLAANPKTTQPTDANNVSIASGERRKPAAKSTMAEYKYVASKNSKVFHRPDCSSAKRISPKNLVGYNSREDTIKAGKRPCKICKP